MAIGSMAPWTDHEKNVCSRESRTISSLVIRPAAVLVPIVHLVWPARRRSGGGRGEPRGPHSPARVRHYSTLLVNRTWKGAAPGRRFGAAPVGRERDRGLLLLGRVLDLAHRLVGLRLGLVDERVPRLTHELALRLRRRERHPDGRPDRQRDGAEREGVLLRDATGVVADLPRDVLDLVRHLAGGLLDLADLLADRLLDVAEPVTDLVADALSTAVAARAVAGVVVAGRVPRLAGHPAAVAEGLTAPVAAAVAPVVVAAAGRVAGRDREPAEPDADHRGRDRVAPDRVDDAAARLLGRLRDVADHVACLCRHGFHLSDRRVANAAGGLGHDIAGIEPVADLLDGASHLLAGVNDLLDELVDLRIGRDTLRGHAVGRDALGRRVVRGIEGVRVDALVGA